MLLFTHVWGTTSTWSSSDLSVEPLAQFMKWLTYVKSSLSLLMSSMVVGICVLPVNPWWPRSASAHGLFTPDQRKGKLLRKVLPPNFVGAPFRVSAEVIGINTVGKMPFKIALTLLLRPGTKSPFPVPWASSMGHPEPTKTPVTKNARTATTMMNLMRALLWFSSPGALRCSAKNGRFPV